MPNSAAVDEKPDHRGNCYILLIKEHLAPDWSNGFDGMTLTYSPTGGTHLEGFILDQSALHGLLARIRDLNLTLISVNRVENEELSEETLDKHL